MSQVAHVNGMFAFNGARLDAIAAAQGFAKGKPQKHHCFPVYQSGNRKQGPFRKIKAHRHKLVHKMMQEYMSVYNLRLSRSNTGTLIRRNFSDAFMMHVTRNFYDDMVLVFQADFGC